MAFLEEYTLLDELGQGGFATVYKVRHNELGYIRAIRVMNVVIARGKEDKTYQRFLDECRLLLRIGNGNHPNIVHICRPLLKDQRAAVEMDYVDGSDLLKYVKKCNGHVPADDVLRLLEDISSALAYCHEDIYRFCMDRVEDDLQDDPEDGSKVLLDEDTRKRLIQKYRVIHNDIHSDNIIRREDGSYVLLDFGLAIQGENVVRSSRRSDGAPEFKAPEKWDGDTELTTQSDIYSFGVVMYEYLTGRVPFPLAPEDVGSAKALYLLGEDHKSKTPDSIYELRKAAFEKTHPGEVYDAPDYPLWLEEVILKCLEKKPEDRFLNGKELHDFVVMKKREDRMRLEEMAAGNNQDTTIPVVLDSNDIVDDPADDLPEEALTEKPEHPVPGKKTWIVIVSVLAFLLVGAIVSSIVLVRSGNKEKAMAIAERDNVIAEINDSLAVAKERIEVLIEEAKPVQPLDVSHPAIEYLDQNPTWVRSKMEAIPELEGLWDALNSFDYTTFASYFTLLNNSASYYDVINLMRRKQDVLQDLHKNGTAFCEDSDENIIIHTYLMKLRFVGTSFSAYR